MNYLSTRSKSPFKPPCTNGKLVVETCIYCKSVFEKKKHEIGILDPIFHHFKGVNGRHVQRRKLLGKLFQGTYIFFLKKKKKIEIEIATVM